VAASGAGKFSKSFTQGLNHQLVADVRTLSTWAFAILANALVLNRNRLIILTNSICGRDILIRSSSELCALHRIRRGNKSRFPEQGFGFWEIIVPNLGTVQDVASSIKL
jgi:hypothetical protein